MRQKSEFTKIIGLAVGVVLLYWGLNHYDTVFGIVGLIFGFLFPFVLGGGIAFLLNIPMRFLEEKLSYLVKTKKPRGKKMLRGVSILLTLGIITAVILAVVLIVMPQIALTVVSIKDQIPAFIVKCKETAMEIGRNLPDLQNWLGQPSIDIDKIGKEITGFAGMLGGKALNTSISFATSVFSGIFNFCLAIVFAIYMLASKETLKGQAVRCLQAYCPKEVTRQALYVGKLADKTFAGFFTGQCLEALILGTLFFITMSVLGFPYVLLISVLIGFTALIPVFGGFIGCGVGAFLILVVDPMQALWFVVFFLVMQQLEGNLIYPRVMGNSVGLPPMWVFLAVTLGGSMFGVLGMLLFIPTLSVVYTLVGLDIRKRLKMTEIGGSDERRKKESK